MGTPFWTDAESLVEVPQSPVTVIAEKMTRTRTYRGHYAVCEGSALPRGTSGTGAEAGFSVAQSTVSRERGNAGLLVVVWEANGPGSGATLDLPEAMLTPVEQNPVVERHPKVAGLSDDEHASIHTAVFGSTPEIRAAAKLVLDNSVLPTKQKALSLYGLLVKGTQSFYLAGLQYTWSYSSWTVPAGLVLGGYIETPGGPLAEQIPSNGSWLRLSDRLEWRGGQWRVTTTWIGGPIGHWDTFLYTPAA